MTVSYRKIDSEHEGQRIDNYLVSTLKNIPRTKIYNVLRRGEVRVNKGRVKPSYRLQLNDSLRIPPLQDYSKQSNTATESPVSVCKLELEILFENQHLLIVNKPAGLAVHGGSGINLGLIERLRLLRPTEKLELVHRLDKETSGALILAKSRKSLVAMHELLQTGKISKGYHVVVRGYVGSDFKTTYALAKTLGASGERVVRVTSEEEGKNSVTKFSICERMGRYTLLQAQLITGRTHQIRVHCQAKSLPIIGDDKYGDRALNKALRLKGIRRMLLHARTLHFKCPISGEDIAVCAPYDQNFAKGLEICRKS